MGASWERATLPCGDAQRSEAPKRLLFVGNANVGRGVSRAQKKKILKFKI